ncbi:MAG: hypothetical protein ACR2G4_10740 [Pyrinomonadaceae bacterium]
MFEPTANRAAFIRSMRCVRGFHPLDALCARRLNTGVLLLAFVLNVGKKAASPSRWIATGSTG